MKLMLMTLELNQITPALQIPMAYVYLVIPISGLLMAMFALEGVYKDDLPVETDLIEENQP
jgi:TRAP-type C4-dicarboxylate transport system permease small subunit